MAGGARLIGVDNDEDLDRWIRGGSRLVLVRPFALPLSRSDADGSFFSRSTPISGGEISRLGLYK